MNEEKKQTAASAAEPKSDQAMPDILGLARETIVRINKLFETALSETSSTTYFFDLLLREWQTWRRGCYFDNPTTEPLEESTLELAQRRNIKEHELAVHIFEKFLELYHLAWNRDKPVPIPALVDEFFGKVFQTENVGPTVSVLRCLIANQPIEIFNPKLETTGKLLAFFPNKTNLELDIYPLPLEGYELIFNTLPPRIHCLSLKALCCTEFSEALMRAIKPLPRFITELDLSKFQLRFIPTDLKQPIMTAIANSNVLCLNLSNIQLGHFLEANPNFLEPLKQSKLKYIDLSYNILDKTYITEEVLTTILQASCASHINLCGNFEIKSEPPLYYHNGYVYDVGTDSFLPPEQKEKAEKSLTELRKKFIEALINKIANAIMASGKTVILEDNELGRAVKERVKERKNKEKADASFEMLKGMHRTSGSTLYEAFSGLKLYDPNLRGEILGFVDSTAEVMLVKDTNDPALSSLISSLQAADAPSEHKGDRKRTFLSKADDKTSAEEIPKGSAWNDVGEVKKPGPKIPSVAPLDSIVDSQAGDAKNHAAATGSTSLVTGYDQYSVFAQTNEQSAAKPHTNSDQAQSAVDTTEADPSFPIGNSH